jgi:cell division septation protein DedD
MGYVVGRNSSTSTTDARNDKPKADKEADQGSSPDNPPDTSATPPVIEPVGQSAPSTPPEITKPAVTKQPAAETTKPEVARGKEVAGEVRAKPSPSPAPASPPVHAAAAGDPASGQYWQVVATARPDAEIIAEALGKKGFHVVLAPTPNKDGVFRVLVGPVADAASQAQTRTGLESAGFKNPIMRKY